MWKGCLLGAVVLVGCVGTTPARPTVFTTQAAQPDAVNHAVRVLTQNGFTVANVDDRAGVVESAWQGTRFMYGQNQYNETRYITRRAVVTVAPSGDGSQVMVKVEDMACVNAGAFIAGDEGNADCVAVAGLVPPDQSLLDQLGADLAGALGLPPRAASAQ